MIILIISYWSPTEGWRWEVILILIHRARPEMIILECFLHFSLRAADTASRLQARARRKVVVTALLLSEQEVVEVVRDMAWLASLHDCGGRFSLTGLRLLHHHCTLQYRPVQSLYTKHHPASLHWSTNRNKIFNRNLTFLPPLFTRAVNSKFYNILHCWPLQLHIFNTYSQY